MNNHRPPLEEALDGLLGPFAPPEVEGELGPGPVGHDLAPEAIGSWLEAEEPLHPVELDRPSGPGGRLLHHPASADGAELAGVAKEPEGGAGLGYSQTFSVFHRVHHLGSGPRVGCWGRFV